MMIRIVYNNCNNTYNDNADIKIIEIIQKSICS